MPRLCKKHRDWRGNPLCTFDPPPKRFDPENFIAFDALQSESVESFERDGPRFVAALRPSSSGQQRSRLSMPSLRTRYSEYAAITPQYNVAQPTIARGRLTAVAHLLRPCIVRFQVGTPRARRMLCHARNIVEHTQAPSAKWNPHVTASQVTRTHTASHGRAWTHMNTKILFGKTLLRVYDAAHRGHRSCHATRRRLYLTISPPFAQRFDPGARRHSSAHIGQCVFVLNWTAVRAADFDALFVQAQHLRHLIECDKFIVQLDANRGAPPSPTVSLISEIAAHWSSVNWSVSVITSAPFSTRAKSGIFAKAIRAISLTTAAPVTPVRSDMSCEMAAATAGFFRIRLAISVELLRVLPAWRAQPPRSD